LGFTPSKPVRDSGYLLRRAEAEAEAAERATSAASAEAHHRLASAYLDRIFGDEAGSEQAMARARMAGPTKKEPRQPLILLRPVDDISDFTDLLVRLD
jgi:hypothetical protein